MNPESATAETSAGHLAIGPDGANLLGYLTALGSLALLTRARPTRAVRLGWALPREGPGAGSWHPVFSVQPSVQRDEILSTLNTAVQACHDNAVFDQLDANLKTTTVQMLRQVAVLARSEAHHDRRAADLLAALAASGATDLDNEVKPTPLRALTGAGHQDFLKTLRDLSEKVQVRHIYRALFEQWSYADDKLTFRWDPADFRSYALRARDPSADSVHPVRTEWGANRLAFEGLAFFPMVWSRKPGTVGFQVKGDEEIRWPIWTTPVSAPVVRSLLVHPDLFADGPGRLGRMGVTAVMRARRFQSGKGFVNFTPAQTVWIDREDVVWPSLPYV